MARLPPVLLALCAVFLAGSWVRTISGAAAVPRALDTRPSATTRAALARADSLARAFRPAEGLALLEPLAREALQRGDAELEVAIELARARLFVALSRPTEERQAGQRALNLARARRDTAHIVQALRWIADGTEKLGRTRESDSLWREVRTLAYSRRDSELMAHSERGLAFGAVTRGDNRAARDGFARATAMFERLGLDRAMLASLAGLGRAQQMLGETEAARVTYQRVLDEAERRKVPSHIGHALNNLGQLEENAGDPARAITLYARAAASMQKHGNHRGALYALRNLAAAEARLGHTRRAEAVLDSALATARSLGTTDLVAELLVASAALQRRERRPAAASRALRTALDLRAAAPAEVRSEAALELSALLSAEDLGDSALASLDAERSRLGSHIPAEHLPRWQRARARLLLTLGRPREALFEAEAAGRSALAAGVASERPSILAVEASCWRALGRDERALAVLAGAARAWESLRARPDDPEWRERVSYEGHELGVALASVLLDSEETPESMRVARAFDAIQRFKARTLRERLLGPGAAAAEAPITLHTIQSQVLRPGELLLDAWLGEREGFVFAVTRDDARVVRLSGGADSLGPKIAFVHRLLRSRPASGLEIEQACERATSALEQGVLQSLTPLVRRASRVMISPDGPLHLVPLGALDPEVVREVAIIPSATFLAEIRQRRLVRADSPPRVLALAPPEGERLLGAIEETRRLAAAFEHVERKFESNADRTQLARYAVLHFASHVRLDDQYPWRSAVRLTADSTDAGLLRAAEIARLRLSADLAVLSGCESAGGRALSGEGVQGLSSGFLGAGVPAIVASLWPVDDLATLSLTTRLYEHLAAGETAGIALAHARRATSRDPRSSHPFYWAGFVLIGDPGIHVSLTRRRLAPGRVAAGAAGAIMIGAAGWLWLHRPRAAQS